MTNRSRVARTRISALAASCLMLGCLLAPLSASAALVSQFSYSVNGGTIIGPLGISAITGGTVTVTPGAPVSTPVNGLYTPVVVGWNLVNTAFTPVAGYTVHSLYAANPSSLILDRPAGGGTGTVFGLPFFASFGPATSALTWTSSTNGIFGINGNITLFSVPPSLATVPTIAGTFSISAVLGSEIRTIVPEPTTGTLVGMGMVLLGAGAGRRRVFRSRKALVE